MTSTIKTNLIYGLLALIPIGIVVFLVAQVVQVLTQISKPLAENFGIHSFFGIIVSVVLAILVVLAVCFVVGSLVRTRLGQISFQAVEDRLFKKLPGYEIIGNVLRGFAEKRTAYRPALVSLYGPGTAVLAFIVEERDGGPTTVFVPSSPALTVGSVHFVEPDRVSPLDASIRDVADCLSQWGIGSTKVTAALVKGQNQP